VAVYGPLLVAQRHGQRGRSVAEAHADPARRQDLDALHFFHPGVSGKRIRQPRRQIFVEEAKPVRQARQVLRLGEEIRRGLERGRRTSQVGEGQEVAVVVADPVARHAAEYEHAHQEQAQAGDGQQNGRRRENASEAGRDRFRFLRLSSFILPHHACLRSGTAPEVGPLQASSRPTGKPLTR
jgi:hypothetical protein